MPITDNEFNSLLNRIKAIETRINDLTTIMEKVVTLRALTGTRVILEEKDRELQLLVDALASDMEIVKRRLRL